MDFPSPAEALALVQELHWGWGDILEQHHHMLGSASHCAGISARGIFSLCWKDCYCIVFPELSPIFILVQDHSGNASSFFSSLPPFLCNFWEVLCCSSVLLFSFKSVSQLSIVNITHQFPSWSQTSSSSLRTQKCGFYSNGQIVTRPTKITRKDLIFLKQNSVLILSVYVLVGENFLYCT